MTTCSQDKAIRYICSMMGDDRHRAEEPTYETIVQCEIDPTDYGVVWITIETGFPNARNTLLNVLHDGHWHIAIGKRGKMEAYSYPESLRRFAGRGWCGIHIRK